jgi:hypothetical protein
MADSESEVGPPGPSRSGLGLQKIVAGVNFRFKQV